MFNLHRRLEQRTDRRRIVDPWSRFDGGGGEEEELARGLEERAEGLGEVAVGDLRRGRALVHSRKIEREANGK